MSMGDQTPSSCDLLLTGGAVVTMDDERRILDPGAIAIKDDRILAVAAAEQLADVAAGRVIDCRGKAVIPGLIDCHSHLFQTLGRGLGEGMALWPWLCDFMWPYSAELTRAEAVCAARLGALEAARGGITCVVDNHYAPSDADTTLAIAATIEELGLRGSVARGIFGDITEVARTHGLAPTLFPYSPEEELSITEECVRARAGRSVEVWPAPINVIYVAQDTVARSVQLARDLNTRWHCHCSEAQVDPDIYLAAYGIRPVDWMRREGLLDERATIAHAIWLDDGEVADVGATATGISYNPDSNQYLASGPLRLRSLREAGATVGLGTDGAACGHRMDMFQAMKHAIYVQRLVTLDAQATQAAEALELATREGARYVGIDAGQLAPGRLADAVVVDVTVPHMAPLYDVVTALVYSATANDVAMTIIGGRVVVEDGRSTLVDEASVVEEAQARGHELAERAGLRGQRVG
jgi:5-methylthioadenosine/S-adenosylhomocysteine deaminase